MGQNAPKKAPTLLQIVIELLSMMTESEAPPVLSARTGMSTTLSVNATALSGPRATVVHNQRQQPCSRTELWNLPSVAQLECPALCRGTESPHDLDCWNTNSMITGTPTISPGQYFYTALAWRCTPPGGPIGCGANPTATTSDHPVQRPGTTCGPRHR